jgi:hypothetical protein
MTLGRRVLLFASALVLAFGLPSLSRAQSLTGSISGQVADAQGGMLPGADVTLTNQDSTTVQRTVTNGEGVFVFASVPAATYSVRVELSGFTAWEATDIVMLLGQRRTVTGITLKVGGVEEVISVTSRPEIAPVDSGEKSARLTAEQIQNVPMVGRSTGELLKLLPGQSVVGEDATDRREAQTEAERQEQEQQRAPTPGRPADEVDAEAAADEHRDHADRDEDAAEQDIEIFDGVHGQICPDSSSRPIQALVAGLAGS